MREIKFRAWDNEFKEMSISFTLAEYAEDYVAGVGMFPCVANDENILMQYTGLKDNTKWEQLKSEEQQQWLALGKTKEEWNGREIYEGDIVTGYTSYEIDDDERVWTLTNPAIVSWVDESCAFYPFNLNTRWRCDVVDIKVIGNIHENPEGE